MDKVPMSELVTRVHVRADDTGTPTRWDSTDVLRYLNEAVREWCRRTGQVRDETTAALTLIAVVPDQNRYTLNPCIYDIRAIRYSDTGCPLAPTSVDVLDRHYPRWRTSTTNRASGYYVEVVGDRLHLVLSRLPQEDDVSLRLAVNRFPRYALELGDSTPCSADDDDHLIDWVLHRMYSHKDPDLYDPVKASDHLNVFTSKFGVRQPRNIEMRYTHMSDNRTKARRF